MYSTAKEQQQGHEVRGNKNVEIDEEEAELQRRFSLPLMDNDNNSDKS
jgi:hypothetical protein